MEELFAEVGESWKEQQGMLNNSGTRKNGKPLLPPRSQETVLPEFGETPTRAPNRSYDCTGNRLSTSQAGREQGGSRVGKNNTTSLFFHF